MSGTPLPENQKELLVHIEDVFGDRLTRLADLAWKEYGLNFEVDSDNALAVFETLKDDKRFLFNMLIDVTAIDWMDKREPRFDVVYQLLSISFNTRMCVRIKVEEENPSVHSVLPLWHAANFLEREVWDMFGITFEGHGDLRRIMMYDEFVGHPLRKDYPVGRKQPRVKLRVPELRNASVDMNKDQLVALPVRQRMVSEKSDRTEGSS